MDGAEWIEQSVIGIEWIEWIEGIYWNSLSISPFPRRLKKIKVIIDN